MLYHCNKDFSGFYSFYVSDSECLNKKIEFGRCPHCAKAILKETKTDFNGNTTTKTLKGHEAESALQKAMLNRLLFISKLSQGTRARQHWCFGDYKKSNKRDEKGHLVHIQIKRNFNGVEVDNFGACEVVYR